MFVPCRPTGEQWRYRYRKPCLASWCRPYQPTYHLYMVKPAKEYMNPTCNINRNLSNTPPPEAGAGAGAGAAAGAGGGARAAGRGAAAGGAGRRAGAARREDPRDLE